VCVSVAGGVDVCLCSVCCEGCSVKLVYVWDVCVCVHVWFGS
jgi:hypothetical protein